VADFFSEIVFCASRRSGRAAYWAIKPPSITNSVPVMNEASSEARNIPGTIDPDLIVYQVE
jgi:hypothetical protein